MRNKNSSKNVMLIIRIYKERKKLRIHAWDMQGQGGLDFKRLELQEIIIIISNPFSSNSASLIPPRLIPCYSYLSIGACRSCRTLSLYLPLRTNFMCTGYASNNMYPVH